MNEQNTMPPADPAAAPMPPQPRPIYTTAQLFDGANEITIMHRGEVYQLRITRQEKLILTK